MGNLYFSEVITEEQLEKDLKENNAICYIAGTGCGKSSWVKSVLAKGKRVLFVTSRRAKVNEDLDEEIFINDPIEYLNEKPICSLLLTNSQLSNLTKGFLHLEHQLEFSNSLKDFINIFDYIVIDEVHSIVCDATFADSSFMVQKFMEHAAFNLNKNVIILTATAKLLEGYLNTEFGKDNRKWAKHDISVECKCTFPSLIVAVSKKAVYEQIVPGYINKGKKIIYFANHTKTITKLYKILTGNMPKKEINGCVLEQNLDDSNIAIITSKENLKKIIKQLPECAENSKLVENELRQNSLLPDDIKILLSTSRLKEGISIFNKDINYVICEAHDLSSVVQYMGRLRESKYVLFVVTNARQFPDNLDKLDYDYCIKKQLKIANEYYRNLEFFEQKIEFINLIEKKNQYIRFNYISLRFEPFFLRYVMQKEDHFLERNIFDEDSLKKWEHDLTKFCKKYCIPMGKYDYNSSLLNSECIEQSVKYIKETFCNKILYGKDWCEAVRYINDYLDIEYSQYGKINQQFKKEILI